MLHINVRDSEACDIVSASQSSQLSCSLVYVGHIPCADVCTTGCMCLNSACSLEGRKGTCRVALTGFCSTFEQLCDVIAQLLRSHCATGRIHSGT